MLAEKVDRSSPGAVFVGNISYETSDQDLLNIMSEVGPVKAMKLVLNRDTGAHKGFGFVEYHSEAHAKSAMANLAGKDLNGRKIRVDYASPDAKKRAEQQNSNNDFSGGAVGGGGGDFSDAHRPVQMARRQANQVPAGPSQHEAVRNALSGLTVYQLYDVLKQMKELCQKKPKDAERILLSKPSLAQALLQAQHMLGMVHTSVPGLDLSKDPSVILPGDATGTVNTGSTAPSGAAQAPAPLLQGPTSGPPAAPPAGLPPQISGGGSARRPLPPQNMLHNAQAPMPRGQPPMLMPNHNQPPQLQNNMGRNNTMRRSSSAQRSAVHPQSIPAAPAPPGFRLIAGFDEPVPENLIQQALNLNPAQIQQLQPQQQRTIQMIRQAVQQQSYGGYSGSAGGGAAYGSGPQSHGSYPAQNQRRY